MQHLVCCVFLYKKQPGWGCLLAVYLFAQLGKGAAYVVLAFEHAAQGQTGDDMVLAVETVDVLFVRIREGFEAHMRGGISPQRGKGLIKN